MNKIRTRSHALTHEHSHLLNHTHNHTQTHARTHIHTHAHGNAPHACSPHGHRAKQKICCLEEAPTGAGGIE